MTTNTEVEMFDDWTNPPRTGAEVEQALLHGLASGSFATLVNQVRGSDPYPAILVEALGDDAVRCRVLARAEALAELGPSGPAKLQAWLGAPKLPRWSLIWILKLAGRTAFGRLRMDRVASSIEEGCQTDGTAPL